MNNFSLLSQIPPLSDFQQTRAQGDNGQHAGYPINKTILYVLIWVLCLGFATASFGMNFYAGENINGYSYSINLNFSGDNNSCPSGLFGKPLKMSFYINNSVTSNQLNELKNEPQNWISWDKKRQVSGVIQFRLPSPQSGYLYDKVKLDFGNGVTMWSNITWYSGGSGYHLAESSFTFTTGDVLYNSYKNSEVLKITYYHNDQTTVFKQVATRYVVVGDYVQTNNAWTTTTPSLPQFILRDPPGDGSYSFIEQQQQICRGHGMSLAIDASANVYGSVKLGVKGSAGFIVQTDYEAYAQLSASLEMGTNVTSASEYEMCLTTTSRFSTDGSNPNLTGSKGDVYIGASTIYQYGIVHSVRFPDCNFPTYTKGMAFAPIGTNSTFMYTEEHILNTLIPQLQTIISNPNSSAAQRQQAEDQLEVWQQLVNVNNQAKATAAYSTQISLSGGTSQEYSVASSTSEKKTVDMSLYIESSVGVEAGFEVGGSGATGGFEVRARTTMGSTSSASNANTNTVGYALSDDDVGDQFNVGIYRDKVFGTPVFKLANGSMSSCPFEGGYQLDQPYMTFSDNTQSTTLNNIPVGQPRTFELKIRNLSDQPRTYNLKVDASTNTSGAIIEGFGENLSSTDDGVMLNVPAQGSLNGAIISIKQANPGVLNYDGIELYLYPLCDGNESGIESRVVVSAHFVNVPTNDVPCSAISLPVNGTVQNGFSNVGSGVASDEQQLAPPGNNCATSWCESTNGLQNSVWFKFVAPSSGGVQISTCDLADFDTQIALYSTINCNNFSNYTLIAANDDGPASCATNYDSWMEVNGLTAGQTYYLVVDGYNGATGNFGISVTALQPPAPANDAPCSAVALPTDGSVHNGYTNANATVSTGEGALAPTGNSCVTSWCESTNAIQNSVWFKFVSPATGRVSISTCDLADFDTQLALFSSSDCNNFGAYTLIAANDDGPASCATNYDSYMEVDGLTGGQTYYVLVDGYSGATGTFGISITGLQAPAPANDAPCSAISIPTDGVVHNGFTNENATVGTGEGALAPTGNDCITSWCEPSNGIQNSVWFKFVAPVSGRVSISTCDLADFDTQLALYSASDCNNFGTYSLIAANDDGPGTCATNYDSYMEVDGLTNGQTYYILVDGYTGSTGNFGINITALQPPAPANDAPCAAISLPTDGTVQTGFTNAHATVATGEGALVPAGNDCITSWCEPSNGIQNSVWFKFVAPASGRVAVSTCDLADFDTQLALYTAGDCNDFGTYNIIAANDDGPASCVTNYDSYMEVDGLAAGQTYYVLVDGYSGATGDFSISITALLPPAPANDAPCAAISLPTDGTVQNGFTNLNATVATGESALAPTGNDCISSWCEPSNAIQNSVWFKFVAPASGRVAISTCDLADFDTQLALYSAGDCNNFGTYTLIAANDDGPVSCSTNFDSYMEVSGLTAGQSYYILVDGYGGISGTFGISVTALVASATKDLDVTQPGVSVFPNPNNGNFKVELSNVTESSVLSVVDVMGKEIYNEPIPAWKSTVDIHLKNLTSGLYFVRIVSENQKVTTKMYIQL
ncbi:MAG: T9SS type A sorting domain-containing protein [Lewinellaceae bacterium]|nr:T9SS type A sorting domain-containing protein [Lewinellaceae bacterium]